MWLNTYNSERFFMLFFAKLWRKLGTKFAPFLKQKKNTHSKHRHIYEACPESIQPFWISRELFSWPWSNLAVSQRTPYCASVNSHSPVGLVSRQWDAVDSLYTVWQSHSQWPSEQIRESASTRLPILQLSYRLFWQNIASPRSVSNPTAHIWLPATSGFSQS